MSAREARRGFVRNFPGVILQYSRKNQVKSCGNPSGKTTLAQASPQLAAAGGPREAPICETAGVGVSYVPVLYCTHSPTPPPGRHRARVMAGNLNFAGAPRRRRGTPPPAKSKMSLKTRWGVLTPESSHDVNVPGNPSRRASRAGNMVHNVTHHNIT